MCPVNRALSVLFPPCLAKVGTVDLGGLSRCVVFLCLVKVCWMHDIYVALCVFKVIRKMGELGRVWAMAPDGTLTVFV